MTVRSNLLDFTDSGPVLTSRPPTAFLGTKHLFCTIIFMSTQHIQIPGGLDEILMGSFQGIARGSALPRRVNQLTRFTHNSWSIDVERGSQI
jgi:hypothetical protein